MPCPACCNTLQPMRRPRGTPAQCGSSRLREDLQGRGSQATLIGRSSLPRQGMSLYRLKDVDLNLSKGCRMLARLPSNDFCVIPSQSLNLNHLAEQLHFANGIYCDIMTSFPLLPSSGGAGPPVLRPRAVDRSGQRRPVELHGPQQHGFLSWRQAGEAGRASQGVATHSRPVSASIGAVMDLHVTVRTAKSCHRQLRITSHRQLGITLSSSGGRSERFSHRQKPFAYIFTHDPRLFPAGVEPQIIEELSASVEGPSGSAGRSAVTAAAAAASGPLVPLPPKARERSFLSELIFPAFLTT